MHWDSWVKGAWNHHDNSYTVTYFHSHLQGSGVAGDPCHLTFIYLTKGSVAQTPGQTREDKKVLLQRTHIITLWTQLTEWAHNFHGSVTGRTGYWQYWLTRPWWDLSWTYILFNWKEKQSMEVNIPQWNWAAGIAAYNREHSSMVWYQCSVVGAPKQINKDRTLVLVFTHPKHINNSSDISASPLNKTLSKKLGGTMILKRPEF